MQVKTNFCRLVVALPWAADVAKQIDICKHVLTQINKMQHDNYTASPVQVFK